MRFQETILGRLGKALHLRLDETPVEPLPERWVELIRYLDEQERKRPERRELKTNGPPGAASD